MAASKVKMHRLRTDGSYIFAALFAMFGSYAILGSYADSKPLKTYEPGVYQLSEFKTKEPLTYKLGVKSGLHYCLSPVSAASNQMSVLIKGRSMSRAALQSSDNGSSCFVATKNYSRVDVQIPAAAGQATTITVSQ